MPFAVENNEESLFSYAPCDNRRNMVLLTLAAPVMSDVAAGGMFGQA